MEKIIVGYVNQLVHSNVQKMIIALISYDMLDFYYL